MHRYNTIISFGSGQLQEFNIPAEHRRAGVYIVTVLVDPIARDLMFRTPGIGSGFCTSYPYKDYISKFEEFGGAFYTYEELMLLRKMEED